jgi:hypothetical protein
MDTDQYEHPAFISAICEAFFWTHDTFAIHHHERFSIENHGQDKFKGIPLPAVAFVLTMVSTA